MSAFEAVGLDGPAGRIQASVFRPAGVASFPAILLLQEGIGVTSHLLDVAQRLAAQGYFVLVPDLYCRDPERQRLTEAEGGARRRGALGCSDVSRGGPAMAISSSATMPEADATSSFQGLWAFLFRAVCRSIEIAAQVCGTTAYDDAVERPELTEGRAALLPWLAPAHSHVNWASLTDFDRGRIARELAPQPISGDGELRRSP